MYPSTDVVIAAMTLPMCCSPSGLPWSINGCMLPRRDATSTCVVFRHGKRARLRGTAIDDIAQATAFYEAALCWLFNDYGRRVRGNEVVGQSDMERCP